MNTITTIGILTDILAKMYESEARKHFTQNEAVCLEATITNLINDYFYIRRN